MITFDQFWQLLYDHGASLYHKRDCFELWDTLAPNQQQQLHDAIAAKLRDRRFVDYNPLRAMRDNLRQLTAQQAPALPKNYNGSRDFERLVATGTLVTASYNGSVGIYTEADAAKHAMTVLQHLKP